MFGNQTDFSQYFSERLNSAPECYQGNFDDNIRNPDDLNFDAFDYKTYFQDVSNPLMYERIIIVYLLKTF